jgi:DNA sulfur modification protein DndD
MILKQIEVDNYGVFQGKQTFDMRPLRSKDFQRPIILFGGKNGSGKTTLFEAVRLCLYGSSYQGRKLSRSVYNKHLRQRIHRSLKDSSTLKASISVEFDYAKSGRTETYLVKRLWACTESETVESLEIYQNGTRLRDINEEQWQEFLMELIPLGVSKLFFFDGEQIQNLAEEEADNEYLLSSLHSLLGLDLVERLQTDLRIYLLRKAKEEDKRLETDLTAFENKSKALEEQVDTINQKKAQVQTEIDRLQSEIEGQEHQIAREGGGFASKREELKALKEKLDNEIEETKERIRNLCSGLLPFTLVPDLCISLRNRLLKEERYEQKKAAAKALDSIMEDFIKEIQNNRFWEEVTIPTSHREKVVDKVAKALRRSIRLTESNSVTQAVHTLSAKERSKLLDGIDKALNETPTSMKQLTADLERLVRERQEVDSSLFKAPMDDVLQPLLQRLSSLHKELGVLQGNHRDFEEDLRKAQYELSQIKFQLEKKLEQKSELQRLSERLQLARKVQLILGEYVHRLRQEKITTLCDSFLECFRRLSNKEHLIEKIDISPNDFSVTLWDRNGQIIPKNQLAAGEKQIYAVAMLWALARTSGRPLPFIIDTPLGRLDTSHRENLVQRFFPHASHQAIVFSTDTEIDQEYFDELQPYIARAYHLMYNENTGATEASLGYFWEGKKEDCTLDEFQSD